ncbi:SLATT domain-containing protein [Porticoccaceae bacterium]|nr:SLATT domain-containing protein [Porticoccaceae bacterium]
MADVIEELKREAIRVEEDCNYSSKGHFEQSARWKKVHYWLGIPSALIAGCAGISAFEGHILLAGGLAILVTAFTSIITFLNPSGKSSEHLSSGNSYLTLRNKARLFRNVHATLSTEKELRDMLLALSNHRDDLNSTSPQISKGCFEKARKNIEEGQTNYKVDEKS